MPNRPRVASRTRLFMASVAVFFLFSFLAYQTYFVTRVQGLSATVVISQIYGGAGCGTAGCSTYKNDYIELFNRGTSPVSLTGWSVQYAAATGTSWQVTALSNVTLQPGQYYLVGEGAGANGVNSIPTPDIAGTIGMSATAGKIALVSSTTPLSGSCPSGGNLVDLIGYGGTASCFETSPAPAPSTTTADLRGNQGCTETDNNSADFTATTPNPRNTASPTKSCVVNQAINPTCPSPPTTTQGTATSSSVSATDPDGTVVSASITSAPVAGITLDSFVAATAAGGTATATLNVANTTAAGTYSVTIAWANNDSPTAQTANCNVVVTVNPPNQVIAPSCPATLNTTEGTATSTGVSASDPDGTVTTAAITSPAISGITLDSFTPAGAPGETATATLNVANTTAVGTYNVTIQYSNNDSPTPQTANCTVVVDVQAPPPPPGSVVISQVYGGGGNSGATIKNDFIEIKNHTGGPVTMSNWSVQYSSAAGTTWQVTPLTDITLAPGQYYLIRQAAGSGGTVELVPDATGSIAMAATAGKVALVSNTTPLTGSCPSGAAILDFVGFGATASCFEGSGPTPAPSNTSAVLRKDAGCTDTDNNNSDFSAGAPNPRNTSSPTDNCAVLKGTGSANPFGVTLGGSTTLTVVVSPGSDPTSTGISVTADLSSIGGSASQPFSGDGTTFTYEATVSESTTLGNKLLPVTITDDQLRTANTSIALIVQQPHIVISQVYGGGGNAGATYRNDYVELYNPTDIDFDLTGWSLQYASAAGSGWEFTRLPLGGTMEPGQYYLIALGSNGAVGAVLPAANVSNDDIDISGTQGKIALVSNFDPLVGNCPIGHADIQDFVGYGAADCAETATASSPSNTTAIFRKDAGETDTENNSADFLTAAPNPRRTAPIVEIGPSVFGSEPRNNASAAPRDATVSINFTEPVLVDDGWYDITCVSTGNHNDATVRSFFGNDTYTITPNVNFLAGEQCTVTIFKDAIHDVDSDDTGTNADSLPSNKVFSFTVATGTAPPYPSSVHLTMGNPNGATADLGEPDNYLMEKPEFSLSYNRTRGTANWVSWHLSEEWTGSLARVDTFRADPAVPEVWFRVSGFDYVGSGFDRGHMVPNADRDKETSSPINQATFLMSNMIPQSPDNNQGPWANLENYLRTLLPTNEIYIIAGGAGTGGTGSAGSANTIAGGNVTVPAQTWKVALIMPKDSGDDVTRVNCSTRTLAVIMPNVQGIRNVNWETYIKTVDEVEALTGYDFFSNLPDAVENCVEAGTNGANKLATGNQSATTQEDTAVEITLQAARPDTDPITFSIVSGPANGTLGSLGTPSCTDFACTATVSYTPGLNYNGSDNFTFKVSDATQDSNTSTVTITVNSANDNPDAVDDAATVAEDSGANTINVLSNDNDVEGDTLLVTAVTQATNGSVAITNGGANVSYTPNANFFGSDSFTYTVSDGNGGSDTATVNITVTNVNDAPVLTSAVAMSLISSTNSNLFNVGLTASATDQEGEAVTIQVSVFGDEDDQTATSPGEVHSPDAKDIAPNTLRLRGERVEANDGRVYLIVVTATDSSGGVDRDYHTVVVPKNNKPANIDAVIAEGLATKAFAEANGGTPPPGYFVIGNGPIIGPKQ